jgi:hypothetical protein
MAVLWGPSWPSWSDRRPGVPLVLMEWNVERLWGQAPGSTSPLACVVETVKVANPDLLSLLEVSQDELKTLEKALEMDCVQSDYLGSGKANRGGLALCVRGDVWRLFSGAPQPYLDTDNWRYVFAELQSETAHVNALAVHLRPYAFGPHSIQNSVLNVAVGNPGPFQALQAAGAEVASNQGAHAEALLDRVSRFSDPTLLAGDFNSTRDMALHYRLREQLADTYEVGGRGLGPTTYVGGWLPLRVDFVYATPGIGVVSSSVLDRQCSDHRPILSELTVPITSSSVTIQP